VKIVTSLDDLRLRDPDGKVLVAFMKALEFTTLTAAWPKSMTLTSPR